MVHSTHLTLTLTEEFQVPLRNITPQGRLIAPFYIGIQARNESIPNQSQLMPLLLSLRSVEILLYNYLIVTFYILPLCNFGYLWSVDGESVRILLEAGRGALGPRHAECNMRGQRIILPNAITVK